MEEFMNLESDLQQCGICGRKFLPASLSKHTAVCERNATRKRKVFNSLKQRVEGTELAQFHQRSYLKKHVPVNTPEPTKKSKWREKHCELVNTIRAARGLSTDMSTSPSCASSITVGSERCPTCDRQFGPRAYERHVEWCKERKSRIQRSPQEVLIAKERLDARINYRVPLPNKSKRELIKEKYSLTSTSKTDLKSSSTNLERSLSVRKPKSVSNLTKVQETKSRDSIVNPVKRTKSEREHPRVNNTAVQSKCSPISINDPVKSDNNTNYNPFLTAERQLMELLKCDDFTPYLSKSSSPRPHTTDNTKPTDTTIKNKKMIKSAPIVKLNKTFIQQPLEFEDNLRTLNDDFELIESLINQNVIDDYGMNELEYETKLSKVSKNLFLDPNMNDDKINFNDQQFSDDLSPIDPKLINETDNLLIPDNLKIDHFLDSSNENSISIPNDNLNRSLSVPVDSTKTNASKRTPIKRSGKFTTRQTTKSNNSSSSFGAPRNNVNDKKNSSFLKRSVSLVDSIKPKNLKNKQDVQSYFNQQEKKNATREKVIKDNKGCDGDAANILTADELFDVDDDLYEEYKKYEESYMREKQQKMEELASSGTLTPNDAGSEVNAINVKTNVDSAYSSLNRKAPKVRARTTKLTKLSYPPPQASPTPSPTSSGSEASVSPKFTKRTTVDQRMSKFCHECGNQYPINTAKFCVECGIKRLIL